MQKQSVPQVLFFDDDLIRHAIADDRMTGTGFMSVFTARQALRELDQSRIAWDIIFLDHDIGESKEDGTWLVRQIIQDPFLVEKYKDTPIVIHSLNPIATMNMKSILESAGFTWVHIVPFAWCYFTYSPAKGIYMEDRRTAKTPSQLHAEYGDN